MGNYLKDILDQPRDLSAALESWYGAESLRRMRGLAAMGFRNVLFSGMGSSNFCSIGASIDLNAKGFRASVLSAGELLHYHMGLIRPDTLLVLVSQSGESAEIVRLVERLPAGVTVAAVTNDAASTLGRRGDFTFVLNVPEEESVTTRTYVASLLLMQMMATALSRGDLDAYRESASHAIGALESFLEAHESFTSEAARFAGMPPYVCVTGRGHSLCTVRSGALFVREVVKHPAIDIDGGEFRHGPFEMVDEGFFGIVVAPKGTTHSISAGLAGDIAAKGGRVLLITNGDAPQAKGILTARFAADVDESLSPVVSVAPIQLLADSLAKAKGIEAGKFRWGSKITAKE